MKVDTGTEVGVELAPESRETCDGCGDHVRATWLVDLGGLVLTFCNEHYRRYVSSLVT